MSEASHLATVGIMLTADAATALNTALGSSLASGASLGTATLTARLVGHGKA